MFKKIKVKLSLLFLMTFVVYVYGYEDTLQQEGTNIESKESNDNEIKQYIKYVDTPEATGYDWFYFDGKILRDEIWRFDRNTGVPVVNHRHGFLNEQTNKFHLFETYDGHSYSSTILDLDSINDVIAEHVDEPILRRDMNKKLTYTYKTLEEKFKFKTTLTTALPLPETTTVSPADIDNIVPTDLPSNCFISRTGSVICRRINPNALKSLLG